MPSPTRLDIFVVLAAVGLASMSRGARAADALSGEASPIQLAVQRGADIFAHDSFGGAGTCAMCHLNGGHTAGKLPNGEEIPSLVGAAAHFPRYSAATKQVITLSEQLVRCIAGALQGNPPALGSPELVDLETYVASLSKGSVMGQQLN